MAAYGARTALAAVQAAAASGRLIYELPVSEEPEGSESLAEEPGLAPTLAAHRSELQAVTEVYLHELRFAQQADRDEFAAVCAELALLPNLRIIVLRGDKHPVGADLNAVGQSIGRAVAGAIDASASLSSSSGNRRLQWLELRRVPLYHTGAAVLTSVLRSLPSLQALILESTIAGPLFATVLAKAFSDRVWPQLRTLVLHGNHLSGKGVVAIASHLHKVPQLTELTVVSEGMGSAGLKALAVVMASGTVYIFHAQAHHGLPNFNLKVTCRCLAEVRVSEHRF
jgi:hypothetical protein